MKNTFDFDFKNGEFRMKNGNPDLAERKSFKSQINVCIVRLPRLTPNLITGNIRL